MANEDNGYYKEVDLFGNEIVRINPNKKPKAQTSLNDYEGFLEKFEVKKTTDDCHTPPEVYKAILGYVSTITDLTDKIIIRPFYPNCDYREVEYTDSHVVIDNPPFSIISQIAKYYTENGIKFFIFAPHLTLFNVGLVCTCVVCGVDIKYQNGAVVKTSFLSNLFNGIGVLGATELYEILNSFNKNEVKLPKYEYPENVLTVSDVAKLVQRGISFQVDKNHMKHTRTLDSQRMHKKGLFGSGFIISDKAAADKAAADKAAADKAAADKAAADKEATDKSEEEKEKTKKKKK